MGTGETTTTPEQWRTVLDVNLIGTWNTCAAALPHRSAPRRQSGQTSAGGWRYTLLHILTPPPATGWWLSWQHNELAAAVNRPANIAYLIGVATGAAAAVVYHGLARPDLCPAVPECAADVMVATRPDISNAAVYLAPDECATSPVSSLRSMLGGVVDPVSLPRARDLRESDEVMTVAAPVTTHWSLQGLLTSRVR